MIKPIKKLPKAKKVLKDKDVVKKIPKIKKVLKDTLPEDKIVDINKPVTSPEIVIDPVKKPEKSGNKFIEFLKRCWRS